MQLYIKWWCKNELFVIEGRIFEKNDEKVLEKRVELDCVSQKGALWIAL